MTHEERSRDRASRVEPLERRVTCSPNSSYAVPASRQDQLSVAVVGRGGDRAAVIEDPLRSAGADAVNPDFPVLRAGDDVPSGRVEPRDADGAVRPIDRALLSGQAGIPQDVF